MPYAIRTAAQSQLVAVTLSGMLWNSGVAASSGQPELGNAGCPSSWSSVVRFNGVESDISASDITNYMWGGQTGFTDEDGEPWPTSVPRLKEGVERFFITDINNPASSSMAQSELLVMFDAWGASRFWGGPNFNEVLNFNHLPGGANLLFMDGHVAFQRYGDRWLPEGDNNVLLGGHTAYNMGTWGGAG
jgi:prepilin-type processing-associated H-X9-DG protein